MQHFNLAVLVITQLCAGFLSTQLVATEEVRPNIVVILADDLGYGDVQPLNSSSSISTPNFNRLASEGMMFTDAHSPSAVCTPTRYGLMCGRYPWRSTRKRGVLGGYSKPLVESDRQTIASLMKSAGYDTACVGKWHLGLGWQWHDKPPQDINNMGIAGGKAGLVDFSKPINAGPNNLGFDYSFIVPGSADMSPYVYVRNDRATAIANTTIAAEKFPAFSRRGEIAADFKLEDILDTLTSEACQFIERSASSQTPFFLYFPLTAPHKPVLPHPRFRKTTKLGPYGDFISQVDWTVGQVLKTLDQHNLTENTLLIVTSDNGSFMHRRPVGSDDHTANSSVQGFDSANHQSNGPLRGTKADIWEAGHRVPFFVRWPNKIDAASKCETTICHTDILATVAEVVGQPIDSKSAEDSHSVLNLFQGQTMERAPIIHQSGSGHLAIRSGNWKLVLGSGSGGREKPIGRPFKKPFQLFDLSSDLGETNNLIGAHPEIANKLHQQFLAIAHDDHKDPTKAELDRGTNK